VHCTELKPNDDVCHSMILIVWKIFKHTPYTSTFTIDDLEVGEVLHALFVSCWPFSGGRRAHTCGRPCSRRGQHRGEGPEWKGPSFRHAHNHCMINTHEGRALIPIEILIVPFHAAPHCTRHTPHITPHTPSLHLQVHNTRGPPPPPPP
jgi:hypothetical protein